MILLYSSWYTKSNKTHTHTYIIHIPIYHTHMIRRPEQHSESQIEYLLNLPTHTRTRV